MPTYRIKFACCDAIHTETITFRTEANIAFFRRRLVQFTNGEVIKTEDDILGVEIVTVRIDQEVIK